MAIWVAGPLGCPAEAVLISAYNKSEAVATAARALSVDEEVFRKSVKGEGDFLLRRVFTGHAVGRPRAITVDQLLR
jgi:hypothetical protein